MHRVRAFIFSIIVIMDWLGGVELRSIFGTFVLSKLSPTAAIKRSTASGPKFQVGLKV